MGCLLGVFTFGVRGFVYSVVQRKATDTNERCEVQRASLGLVECVDQSDWLL